VKRELFRWIKGEEKLTAFEATPGKLLRFCSVYLAIKKMLQEHDRDMPTSETGKPP
jgi:hypothetical protein